MVDASGSVTQSNFDLVLDFIQSAIERLPIGPDLIRIAGAMFHSKPKPQFNFTHPSSKRDIIAAFDDFVYPTDKLHGTAIGAALDYITDDLLDGSFTRPGHETFVLLVTDGESQEPAATVETAADRLKLKASKVIVLGISDLVNVPQLQSIASTNDDVYLVAEFNLLENELAVVLENKFTCVETNNATTPMSTTNPITAATTTTTITNPTTAATTTTTTITLPTTTTTTTPTTTTTTTTSSAATCDVSTCTPQFFNTITVDDLAATGPNHVAVADFNGDGDLDLVAAHTLGDAVVWYEQHSASQTYTPHYIELAPGARAVAVGDLNMDGYVDVVSAWYDSNVVAWHRNDGTGGFTTIVVDDLAANCNDVKIVDVDNDGDLDIVAALRQTNEVALYRASVSQGTISWSKEVIAAVDRPWAVVPGDFDGDGDIDVAVSSKSEGVKMVRMNGQGAFIIEPVDSLCADARGLTTGDVNGDGSLDIVVACFGSSDVFWYDSTAGWAKNILATGVADVIDVSTADINGDGLLDALVVVRGTDTIAWYKQDGVGSFTPQTITTQWDPRFALAVDMDQDGDLDIVTAAKAGNLIMIALNECCDAQELGETAGQTLTDPPPS